MRTGVSRSGQAVFMIEKTNTTNSSLAFKPAQFDNLVDGLEYAAKGVTGFNFYSVRGELVQPLPYSEMLARAKDLGARLAGLEP